MHLINNIRNTVTCVIKTEKSQAPKYKSQINTNDRNSKFKTGKIIVRYQTSDRKVLFIGIWNFDIV
jgi:hypothetical protein